MLAGLKKTLMLTGLIFTGVSVSYCRQVDQDRFDHNYTAYAELLGEYVVDGSVKYAELKGNRKGLDEFVLSLKTADAGELTRNERLAFYINAYNAITLRSILDAYPVGSIKEIDGVWDKKEWSVAGQSLTLNDIEHEILRKVFDEPRIHVAVNCASIGCPPLMSVPFLPDSLDEQLRQAATGFAGSMTHNVIDELGGRAEISAIFDWFGDDFLAKYYDSDWFDGLSKKENGVLGFLVTHLPAARQAAIVGTEFDISYMKYDWSLNEAK